jgi:hypothetical protein
VGKIAFIAANESGWGGSEALWSQAAERLFRQGAQVHISARKWDRPVKQIEELRSLGCGIDYRPFPPPLWERVRQRIRRDGYVKRHVKLASPGADLIVISQGNTTDALPWRCAGRRG